jgi:hypothetical protein
MIPRSVWWVIPGIIGLAMLIAILVAIIGGQP